MKKTIINKINNIPIGQKFILIYMLLILLPLLIVYIIFFSSLSDEVALREQSVVTQSTDRVISDVSYLVNSCFTIARDVAIDQEINEMLSKEYSDSAEYFNVYYEKLRDQIQMYATGYNNVIRVSIYTDNPTVLSGGNIYNLTNETRQTPWYKASQEAGYQETIVSWVEKHMYIKDKNLHRISVIRKMDEYSQIQNDMFIRIDIEEGKLKNILQSTYNMNFVITDMNNVLIADYASEENPNTYEQTTFMTTLFESNNTIEQRHIHPAKNVTWKLYSIVPKQTLTDLVKRFGGLIAVVLSVSLLFSIFFIMIFSSSYNDRIQLLKEHMHKVENSDFTVVEGEHGNDEIGGLIRAFNTMTKRINGLVNEVLKFKLKEKEHQLEQVKAELKFLQSQMDPHFLFNTLNAILVVSSRYGYHEITDIIKYLSKTLRYLIEWDDSMVTLEKELTFTKMYLEIEKFRFRDKFDFEIYIENQLEEVQVPKLSLQPFVENACKHGIQASKSVGKLFVRCYKENDFVVIIIEDNGIGMTSEQLNQIYSNHTDSHIGITNVLKRLKIQYSDKFKFDIVSKVDLGTKVMIRIPYSDMKETLLYEEQ